MRVVHVITQLKRGGGAEAALFRLVCADQKNHHIVVSMRGVGEYGELLLQRGVEVVALDMRPNRISFAAISRLKKVIRKHKPAVVQTWMYHADIFGGLVGKIAGCKHIVWGIRNSTLDSRGSSLSARIIARICAILSPVVPSKIICVSNSAVKVHADLGYDQHKMIVCYNGYNFDKIVPKEDITDEWRSQLDISSDMLLFGVASRWDPQKDYPTLVNSLARFAKSYQGQWLCVMAGREIDESNTDLVDALEQAGIRSNVRLLGVRKDIPDFMKAIDVLLLSSSYGEGFPNVLAEAMICDTPCISTDVGDAAYIVGETGWVVDSQHPQQFAEAMLSAAEYRFSDAWVEKQRECHQRVASRFSIETMVATFNTVWSDLQSPS